ATEGVGANDTPARMAQARVIAKDGLEAIPVMKSPMSARRTECAADFKFYLQGPVCTRSVRAVWNCQLVRSRVCNAHDHTTECDLRLSRNLIPGSLSHEVALVDLQHHLGIHSRKDVEIASDNARPSRLVTGTEACAIVAVEIFVEEDV